MNEKKQVLVIQTIVPPEILLPDWNQGEVWVINRISQTFFFCAVISVLIQKCRPTVMLKFLTVLDGARVGISNYIGLVCDRYVWTWILLVFLNTNRIQ